MASVFQGKKEEAQREEYDDETDETKK